MSKTKKKVQRKIRRALKTLRFSIDGKYQLDMLKEGVSYDEANSLMECGMYARKVLLDGLWGNEPDWKARG